MVMVHSIFVVRTRPVSRDLGNFFALEKNCKMYIVFRFSAIKLCLVINVLNNKTITLPNLVEFSLILAKFPSVQLVFCVFIGPS